MSLEQKKELLPLLQAKARFIERNKARYFRPYPWQVRFYAEGKRNKQRMLMAANRVGKTEGSCFELRCHLTGRYPDWWEGERFTRPVNAWALGVSYEQIRDVLQPALLGQMINGAPDGTGMIEHECLGERVPGMVPKTLKDIKIKYESGGWSNLSFKVYSQGQSVLMGSSVDVALIDEEPKDDEIYPQVLTRTMTGGEGSGGLVILSMTPEYGETALVHQFLRNPQKGQYLQSVTWDDAPHLTEDVKQQMLQAIPPYQRDMRSRGIPSLGGGLIFPVSEQTIRIDGFTIQPHWPRICGADFGYDHPTAMVWLTWDRDSDTVYIYDCFRKRGSDLATSGDSPVSTYASAWRKRGDWIPVAWPHDGLQHDKSSGVQLAKQWADEGVYMLHSNASFEGGGNGVEAGLMMMLDRMQTGRLKVAAHLADWWEEFRMYHREDGKVVKERDDLMAATRYGLMMLRYAALHPHAVEDFDASNRQYRDEDL